MRGMRVRMWGIRVGIEMRVRMQGLRVILCENSSLFGFG